MTNKQTSIQWEEFTKEISESTSVDIDESYDPQQKRMQILEADPEEWFRYYFPKFTIPEPVFFDIRTI